MTGLLLWFVMGASLATFPAFPPGTEVRVVSPDLLTVYSSGRVEQGRLIIDLPLEAGTEVRLLVFAPDISDAEMAAALARGAALHGQVAADRGDILVRFEGGAEASSLREYLLERHGIELVLTTRRSR